MVLVLWPHVTVTCTDTPSKATTSPVELTGGGWDVYGPHPGRFLVYGLQVNFEGVNFSSLTNQSKILKLNLFISFIFHFLGQGIPLPPYKLVNNLISCSAPRTKIASTITPCLGCCLLWAQSSYYFITNLHRGEEVCPPFGTQNSTFHPFPFFAGASVSL
jgi:hypothetical protein